ncbi:MAG: cytochrome c3 family protein [bacterium]
MRRRISVLPFVVGACLLTLIFSPMTYAVDGSGGDYNGHQCEVAGRDKKQVCANCHKPHGGNGKKIWARDLPLNKKIETKDLCKSCHIQPNNDFITISSGLSITGYSVDGKDITVYGNVFLTDGADHVMGTGVAGRLHTSKADVPTVFPVDTKTGGEGFYCGSCHNPHKQPNDAKGKPDESGNGDYLRVLAGVSAGQTHDRKGFCRQCHPMEEDTKCDGCHHPHGGYYDPTSARRTNLIFVNVPIKNAVSRIRFDNPVVSSIIYRSKEDCQWCHCSDATDESIPQIRKDHGNHPLGRTWANTSCAVSGCHRSSTLPSDNLFRLDGYYKNSDGGFGEPLPFSQRTFECISCHLSSHHRKTDNSGFSVPGNPYYLLYDSFQDDNTAYCEHCHGACKPSPKSASLLTGLHYKTKNDPTNRAIKNFAGKEEQRNGCMFCHFIHLDKNDPRDVPKSSWAEDKVGETRVRADINALMRVPPRALSWGNQGNSSLRNNLTERYEAMCYGCHGDPAIVGPYDNDGGGSLLNAGVRGFFSHRFACLPSSVNTKANTGIGEGKFPLADGKPGAAGGVMDDYGTGIGQIYCGTCHDVHNNQKPPYLYQLGGPVANKDHASPYKSDDYTSNYDDGKLDAPFPFQSQRDGFCEQCHCAKDSPDPMDIGWTHPVGINEVPNPLMTGVPFTEKFYGGGSGSNRGITYGNFRDGKNAGVICLTCHNVHAASTSWDGAVDTDPSKARQHGKLLVMDNFSTQAGSDMCGACHKQFYESD